VVAVVKLICYLQEYSALFEGAGNNPGEKTLEDKFFEHEVNVNLCVHYHSYRTNVFPVETSNKE
jgi:V-type H+-transporting ATPase subunit d